MAVVLLRAVSLLALAAPVLVTFTGRRAEPGTREGVGNRTPLVANFAALAAYFPSLVFFAGSTLGLTALLLAAAGLLLALAGGALIARARAELGPAWSLVPRADQAMGFVVTGPYRLVRHPIYLGYAVLSVGLALAFGNWPALAIVLFGIVPTFVWRARAEEALLARTLGDRYDDYRRRTRLVVPYIL